MFTFDNITLDRILVPVDGSNQSKEALRRAAFIARQFDASITLLSVVEFGKVMSGIQQVSTGGYMPEHLTAGAEEMLKKMAKLVPEDIHVETEALLGDPAEVVVEEAEEEHYDLVVMGSRGLGKIKGIFMGSVSQQVVQECKCPVLVIHG
ncbi:MAG: universal stress protein [Veillonellaceae bacterium]|nr:MAG: universal stress protein [Veillonellaceae bacterium]